MPSDPAKNGEFLFAIPNFAGAPVNLQVNQQAGMPVPNFQGNLPVCMPIVNFNPMLQSFQMPGHLFHSIPAQLKQPSAIPTPQIPIYQMDVEDLARWVQAFANFKHWNEADEYAKSFRKNAIDGRKIVRMSNNDLWGLEIAKLGHRLEILKAVRELCSCPKARCAAAMERYHHRVSTYSDSETSSVSFDTSPLSAPEPPSWSGGRFRRNIRRRGRESDRTSYSDGDREDYVASSGTSSGGMPEPYEITKEQKPVVSRRGKNIENKAFDTYEGQRLLYQKEKDETIVSGGHGSNNLQNLKIDNVRKADNSRDTDPPFIDFSKMPLDGTMQIPMTKCRRSEAVTPQVNVTSRTPSPSSNTSPEEDPESRDKWKDHSEEYKNQSTDNKFTLPSS